MTLDSSAILSELSKQSTVIILSALGTMAVDNLYYGYPIGMGIVKDGLITASVVSGAVVAGEIVGLSGRNLWN